MSDSEALASADEGQEDSDKASVGLPDPDEMSQEEIDEIEAERKRRLDPENRPEMAEVDNTQRQFDVERGEFLDSPSDEADAG
jgi:hypothetical protein